MSEVREGALFAVPYVWNRLGTPDAIAAHNSVILDTLCAHPHWYAAPMERDQIRETAAWMLTHPEHLKWELWLGGKFVGMIHLSRLVPGVDCLLHFALSGVTLLSARKLLWNFLGSVCFGQMGLQRVSFECPENVPTLIRYMRLRLCFKYESELSLGTVPLGAHLVEHLKNPKTAKGLHMLDPESSLAKLGSRRESAHWDGEKWRDLLLLRLLKSEYDAHCTLRADSQATQDLPLESVPHVVRPEARRLSTANSSGPPGSQE